MVGTNKNGSVQHTHVQARSEAARVLEKLKIGESLDCARSWRKVGLAYLPLTLTDYGHKIRLIDGNIFQCCFLDACRYAGIGDATLKNSWRNEVVCLINPTIMATGRFTSLARTLSST